MVVTSEVLYVVWYVVLYSYSCELWNQTYPLPTLWTSAPP